MLSKGYCYDRAYECCTTITSAYLNLYISTKTKIFAADEIDIKDALIRVQDVLKDMDIICEESSLEDSENASDLLMESQILKTSSEMMKHALSTSPDAEFNDDEYYNAIVRI